VPEPAPGGEAAPPPWRARRRPPAPPVSTYRLQLRAEFGFADAAGIAGYLAALGVTHVYLSPILEAAPGSVHGYDVIDHSRVSGALGGEAGFREMVAALRGHGLGVVVDVVPNHMAIPVPESLNRQLWSVLAEGPGSRYAHWFDVDWAAQDGRFLLPILGAPLPDCLADLVVIPAAGGAGAGQAETGQAETGQAETGQAETGQAETGQVLRYFDHVLPIRAGTAGLPLPGLLAAQHYRLSYWRDAATELNWRRFFDVTSLIAVRVEDPRVFAATHQVPLRLLAEGLIDGLRIDHPDGLADPRGYLRRLAAETGGAWVVTEKILGDGEELPGDWQCAGTTGYDALGMVDGLFTDQAGAPALTKVYQDFTGGPPAFADVAEPAKRETAHRTFAAEVSRLVRLAAGAGLTGAAAGDLREVLAELLAGFGVYRAYVVPGETPRPVPVAEVEAAAAAARRHLPARLRPLLDAVRDLALGRWDGRDGAAFVTVFQQTCGPVMAKGVEDTAFYRWSRLVARNEVGGEPGRVGVSPAEFHAFAGRLARAWPATMTTLSTHDTKRQEDVRARLAVLAESPLAWAREVAGWHDRAVALTGGRAPEPDTEYLLWQTLAGAWPVSHQRLAGYLRKAIREAKTATSWTDPDEVYEATVAAFAEAVLADPVLAASVENFAANLAPAARANSLGAKLVQLTMPGVADVYQGCELTGFSLVDPDNRRPVDFPLRARLLGAGRPAGPGQAGTVPAGEGDASRDPAARLDREKLLVTAAALRLRRDHPDWFGGAYLPLPAEGPADRHAVAFARGGRAVTVATRLPLTLAAAGGWAGTVLPLPAPEPGWHDLLTGVTHPGPRPRLAALTRHLPVALLVPAGSAEAGTAR
jgi:(1->4)-alpha-D-glucan 1-alpha-D-glucosylmutase